MNEFVHISQHGDVAVITVDNPPVNALSPGVLAQLATAVQTAADDLATRAVVVMGAGSTFIAGADIREFSKIVSGETPLDFLPSLLTIEDSPKPVVMAIHGAAFGAGLETAMAGHYRVIAPNAQVGQPEVKLGLIPGAAGTQRLPRLAGPSKAAEMCAFGEPVKAPEALTLGIVDRMIEGDLLRGALAFAHEVMNLPISKTRERNEKLGNADTAKFETLRAQTKEIKRGQRAPRMAIDAVEAAMQLSFEEGCRREAELFRRCLHSTESKAMIHAFFGERTVAKIPGISKEAKPLEIRRAAVVGAGTMGTGIAMNFANAGIPVLVKEASQEALSRGMAMIRKNYERTIVKGRLSPASLEERMTLITPQLAYAGFEEVDVVVEAVFEDMTVKKNTFAELDKVTKPSCILASNTSSLSVDEIASVTQRPQQVLGMHFFSPANVMRLLEVVRGKAASDEAIVTAMSLGKRMGKVSVLARNSPGFIGNRMIRPCLREAHFLAEEGAPVESINQALYDFGMAMGPLAVDDLVGIDVSWRIEQEFQRREKPGVRQPLVIQALYQAGRYGQKSGAGWSKYDEQRRPSPDPEVVGIIESVARKAGIQRREIQEDEIVQRCIYALVNEGARILEEGVALRPVDIDIVFLNGYGFPAWRGGPMFYADTIGLENILAHVREFEKQFGPDLWQPAPLLEELAAAGETFSSLSAKSREV
ncbi:MAG: enoyl-CoA hydratase/isomerase family protein [Acidobacteriaceae bacterium]|nr:enoyl-CoA hydratase/isomerase family protein [Acidobacteriaceae bacterium]